MIRIHVWDFPACRPVWRTLGTMPKNHHKDTGWSGHGTASQHSSCTSLMRIWSSVPGTVSHRETRVRRRTCELSWLEVRQDSYQEEFPMLFDWQAGETCNLCYCHTPVPLVAQADLSWAPHTPDSMYAYYTCVS